MFEPLYGSTSTSSSKFILGKNEHIGIITLWTKAREVADKLDSSKYAVMGQFFSAERGLDLMVRNLLANPQITNLVITGVDFSKSGMVLKDFFENGFERGQTEITNKPVWRVKSEYPGYIELDIPEDVLNELRETINVAWIANTEDLNPESLSIPERKRERRVFMKEVEELENKYVAEDVGFVIKGKTVAEVWLKILDTILKFGKESGTHYEDAQREILNLISVITDENPDDLFIPEWLPFDKQHVMQYISQITTGASVPGTSYTYGQRIREWFGKDQVKDAAAKLVREPISRAVVINLWDSTKDLTIGGSPCINHIWLRIREGKLYMTVTIRSNDMFEGYPDNAFGLRSLQEIIRKEVNTGLREKDPNHNDIVLGDLIINSQSAHVYKDSWEKATDIVRSYINKYIAGQNNASLNPDPRGSFVISINGSDIIVDHLSTGSELIGRYKGKSAEELIDKIAKENIISIIGHAMDIGLELANAETAMKFGIEYIQEIPLDSTQLTKSPEPAASTEQKPVVEEEKPEKEEMEPNEERVEEPIDHSKPPAGRVSDMRHLSTPYKGDGDFEESSDHSKPPEIKVVERIEKPEKPKEEKIIIETKTKTRNGRDEETYITS